MTQTNLTPTQKIVKKYLKETHLTMRQFALALGTNHASISNWSAGKSIPSIFLLLDFREFSDWRLEFANEILHIVVPNIFPLPNKNDCGPDTVICDVCGQDKVITPADQSTAGPA